MDAQHSNSAAGGLRALLKGNGVILVLAAGVTLLLAWGAAYAAGDPPQKAWVAMLAVCTVWGCVSVPVLAATGRDGWSLWLRGGMVLDVCLVAWLVALGWLGEVRWVGCLKACAVFYAVGVAVLAAISIPRSVTARLAVAVVTVLVLGSILASPLWVSAYLGNGASGNDLAVATWAIRINPFYGVTRAVSADLKFHWHSEGAMYNWTRLGEYVAVSGDEATWAHTAGLYVAASVLLGALAIVWRLRFSGATRSEAGEPSPAEPGLDD